MVEREGKLEICGGGRGDGGGLDAAALYDHSAVVVGRSVVKEDVVRVHMGPEYLCELLAFAMEHLGLEPFVHAVFRVLGVGVEI